MKKKVATKEKNKWILIVFLLSGIVIGGLLGMLAKDVPGLWWLAYSQQFGLANPLVLDLNIMQLTLGLMFHINVSSILGMVIGLLIYRKV